MSSAMLRPTPPMGLSLDTQEMKAEVLRHVGIGTPVEQAKKVMESHGFECRYDNDLREVFAADGPAEAGIYLICSKSKPQERWLDNLFMSDEIEVYFSFKDGKVSDVRVEHIATCC
jgi:hypothetical protein